MMKWTSRIAAGAVCVVFATGFAPESRAQSGALGTVLNAAEAKRDLRDQQKALFEQLLVEPDNIDLMFSYAKVSIDLEDYEAAISTLERLLIYRQDIPLVRLELAVAYFNLGSYEVAKLYFEQALAEPDLPDTAAARIKPYMEAIAFHTRTSAFSLIANVGITHATNANLGPDAAQIRVDQFGGNVPLVSGRKEADTGVRTLLSVSHIYDLQGANDDAWKTDVTAFALRYFNQDDGDVGFTSIRTGPRLSLTNEQFGPRLRPYFEGQYLNVRDRGLYASYGVGTEYSDTLSPIMSAYGDIGLRYRNFFRKEFTQNDTYNAYVSAGLAYIPLRDLILRASGSIELEFADADFNSNIEAGLRASAEYQYDSGIDWIDRKWSLSGFAEFRTRQFEEPNAFIAADLKRSDYDIRGGVSHIFTLTDGFGIQFDVDALLRESNIVNFDLDNISGTLSLQYRM